ncbi:MAG: ammonia-forming cytochrome c nitrite reductase subunit c552 [Acidobacteria bacterium]|nr:ammonia-forming cytochrome c nitrite reductase subunit c552 [Acidobacteriota bacterium]
MKAFLHRRLFWSFAGVLTLPLFLGALAGKPAASLAAPGKDTCYQCHDEIKGMKEGSKHAKLACTTCHDDLAKHVKSEGSEKPVTKIDGALCGSCHKSQWESFNHVPQEGGARKEKGIPTGRSPMQDKLLAGHGFTFEHNEPRAHAFMVIDQFVVDRFQGGRFQHKNGWKDVNKPGKTWDLLVDKGEKTRLTETAMAGNPTCIQCKTSDHILRWKYMGDKGGGAIFDRTSSIVDVAKATNNPVGCIHCHDPHGTKPRVVRDALIDAIEREGSKNIFAKDGKTDLKVMDFRGFRRIGVMSKTDSRMMCAQCHVEYNCNTGYQWSDDKPVTYADRRTNHFPLKNAKELLAHYKKLDFYDFKHAITGARLIKMQHPEAETYAGSVHDKAGVQCHQCHMPKAKGKDGKVFSAHNVARPLLTVKESCMGCHPKDSVEAKKYEIESIRNFVKGKMRKAEYWIGRLIDTYPAAKRMGVGEDVLAKAREKHEEAHVLWEFWTAENSDGFHNPELARDSLTLSIKAAKDGVDLLNKAMDAKSAPKP